MTPIGSGSFGIVFRSTYNGYNIAVKCISNIHNKYHEGQQSASRIREVVMEIQILSQLSHPNIVSFFGTCVELAGSSPMPWVGLVFELCEGGTLHHAIHASQSARLSSMQKVSIARQISIGMSYLHSRRILHRDLNTKNVLLDSALCPKIADFGCSVSSSAIPFADIPRRPFDF